MKILPALIGLLFLLSNPLPARAAAPGVSGTLSIIPGLGQAVNGDVLEGLGWFAVVIGTFGSGSSFVSHVGYDLWQYNMYDAYRDAGARDTTKYNVFQNYIAAFNPGNAIDPIGAPLLGVTLGYAINSKGSGTRKVSNAALAPVYYGFVGMGEEGLFRGFLFPGFSHLFSSKFVGAVLSSVAFSYFHVLSGEASDRSSSALIFRFLGGMLFAWQANINRYDLRHNIFAHATYDLILEYNAHGILDSRPARPSSSPPAYGLRVTLPIPGL